jgi:hypothetical protein
MSDPTSVASTLDALLKTAERDLDAAATSALRLALAMIEARAAVGLPLATGMMAIAHATEAANLAVQARTKMLLAHRAARKVAAELNLTAFGESGDCPPIDAPHGAEEPAITIVSSDDA